MSKSKRKSKLGDNLKLAEPLTYSAQAEVQLETEKQSDTAMFDNGVRTQIKPIGASGTELTGGYFSEEYLTKLRGRRGAKVFDEMRRSEAQISMLLNAIMNPIKSATWEIQPADEALVPDAKLHQEFIEECRLNMIDWETHLHEALTLIAFGFSVFEVVHQVIFNHPKFGTRNGLKGLAFRSQKTIERWIVSDDTGQLEGVEQWLMGDYVKGGSMRRVMDAQHLLIMTLNKEGDNYEGIAALRPMYGAYFRKNLYLKILAMGIEQNAKGTVIGTVPAGVDSDDEKIEEFKQILQNYVAHESAYITKPEGWNVEVTNHDFDPEKLKNVIVFENTEMINSLCANFLALGTNGGGGAFALADTLSDFMLLGIKCIADIPRGVWNRVLIPNLIKLNFGPQAAYPQLMVSGIDDKAGKDLSEIVNSLVTSGVIKADDKLDESLRKRYGLTKADPATARETPSAAPAFGGAPAQAKPLDSNQLSERRILLAEQSNKKWKQNKTSVKEFMQSSLKTLFDNYKSALKKDWAGATSASKPSLALKLNPSGLNNYKAALREVLAEIANAGLIQAQKQTPWVKNKIKLAESFQLAAPKGGYYDALPPRIKRLIKANADLIAETQNTDINKLVSFQYGSSVAQDNIDQILLDIDSAVLPVLDGSTAKGSSIDAAAGNAVSQSFQQARTEWFFEPEVFETLESFTYYNEEPISEICNELMAGGGVTLAANDPLLDTYATPLHHNCDGQWNPNEKGAKGNPAIKRGGVPITQKGLDSITLHEGCCPIRLDDDWVTMNGARILVKDGEAQIPSGGAAPKSGAAKPAAKPESAKAPAVNDHDKEAAFGQLVGPVSDKQYEAFNKDFEKQLQAAKLEKVSKENADEFYRSHKENMDNNSQRSFTKNSARGKDVKDPSIGIRIGKKVYMLDGQHRLNTALEAGKTAEVVVMDGKFLSKYGVKESHFEGKTHNGV